MKSKNTVRSLETKLYCSCFGHKLISVKKITAHFEEFECRNCGKQFTRDSLGKIVAMTPLLKDINETIFHLHLKRHQGKPNP